MKKLYALSFILLTTLSFGQTPIGLVSAGVSYDENFDGMGNLFGFLPGWTAINANGSALTMALNDGSTSTGNVYNVGLTSGDTDRAFGTLAEGTTTPVLGAVFQNNTGSVATKIAVLARMEQWRSSTNPINETVLFYYSLDATSLTTGNWTPVTTLNLNEKLTTAVTNTAVNGNLSVNYTNMSNTISGLNWANGANLWIKWVDTIDAGGPNGLFAIDEFRIMITTVLGAKQNTIAGLNMYPNPVSKGT